jgi:hypothetical protein
VFADRCGLVFANLPLLYLLAAKTQLHRLLTGYSYESLNIVHRRLGGNIVSEGSSSLRRHGGNVVYTFEAY